MGFEAGGTTVRCLFDVAINGPRRGLEDGTDILVWLCTGMATSLTPNIMGTL